MRRLHLENRNTAKAVFERRPSILVRIKLIFSSERMLLDDSDSKGSVGKKSLVVSLKGLDAKTK
jgi:hypothetical protein